MVKLVWKLATCLICLFHSLSISSCGVALWVCSIQPIVVVVVDHDTVIAASLIIFLHCTLLELWLPHLEVLIYSCMVGLVLFCKPGKTPYNFALIRENMQKGDDIPPIPLFGSLPHTTSAFNTWVTGKLSTLWNENLSMSMYLAVGPLPYNFIIMTKRSML